MKSLSLLLLTPFLLILTVHGQKTYRAKKDVQLRIDALNGTNGSAVAWDSKRKVYYAVIAGNADFPLEQFTEAGEFLLGSTALTDTRGLWYNPKTKTLEGNAAGELGLFKHQLGTDGDAVATEVLFPGQNQPDFQSVGAINPKKQEIYFYYDDVFYRYSRKYGTVKASIMLYGYPADPADLNTTTVIFTGRKGEELGVLDHQANKVYLFNLKGTYSATVQLPNDAISFKMFRFSYANGKIWLYDTQSRSWQGYSF